MSDIPPRPGESEMYEMLVRCLYLMESDDVQRKYAYQLAMSLLAHLHITSDATEAVIEKLPDDVRVIVARMQATAEAVDATKH